QRSLDTGMADVQWIANSYLLALGSLMLLSGSLGDIFGVHRTFRTGIAILGAAGVLSALAWSTTSLIVFHGIQGAGAALMVPGSLAIIRRTFPESEQGRVIGLWAGWSGAIAALGPFVGGALADLSWRAVFWLPVPFAVIAFLVSLRALPHYTTRATRKPDWPGALAIIPALVAMSWAFIRYPDYGFSADVLASGVLALTALFAFVRIERKASSPLVPPGMFNRTLTGANLATFFQYFAFSGTLFLVPFAVQQLAGAPAAMAGIMLLPATLLIAIGSGPSGRITDTHGPTMQMRLGPALFLLGLVLLSLAGLEGTIPTGDGFEHGIDAPSLSASSFVWLTVGGMVLVGIGMVLIIPAITTSAMNASRTYAGAASGLNNAVSRVAGMFANAVIGATLVARFRTASEEILREHGANEETREKVRSSAGRLLEMDTHAIIGPEAAAELSSLLEGAFRLAYTSAMFVNMAAVVLAFVSALLITARRGPD
ncbi:MAG: MFS transporter, partial [Spirochaetota bacterium]